MGTSNPVVTLMGLAKLNEPQNKSNHHEYRRGPGRQEKLIVGGD